MAQFMESVSRKRDSMDVYGSDYNTPDGSGIRDYIHVSDLATAHLCSMNEKYSDQMPWNLTFSYGRALQHDALNAWGGSDREAGQKALIFRSESNSLATHGKALTHS